MVDATAVAVNPEQVKTIVYDLLLALGTSFLVPLFIASVAAMWALLHQLVTKPLETMTEKMDVFGQRIYEVEVNHQERIVRLEENTARHELAQQDTELRLRVLEHSNPKPRRP